MKIEMGLYDENLKQAVLNLPFNDKIDDNGINCDMIFIKESDYGYAEIYRMYDDILVFMIPQYGGTPALTYHTGIHGVDWLIGQLKSI